MRKCSTWHALHDTANRLFSASNALGTTTFAMDLASGLTQTLDDGTHATLYGSGRIAQVNTAGSQYFLGDALGSVRQLTDSAGALVLAKSYDPYGVVSATSGTGQSSYGFTGEQYLFYINLGVSTLSAAQRS